MIDAFEIRTQPWLTSVPSAPGSFVPWIPICPGPPPKLCSTFECAESPNANGPYGPDEFGCFSNSATKYVPFGVGSTDRPTPAGVRRITFPSFVTVSMCAPSDTVTRYGSSDRSTERSLIQPVAPFGRVGR